MGFCVVRFGVSSRIFTLRYSCEEFNMTEPLCAPLNIIV